MNFRLFSSLYTILSFILSVYARELLVNDGIANQTMPQDDHKIAQKEDFNSYKILPKLVENEKFVDFIINGDDLVIRNNLFFEDSQNYNAGNLFDPAMKTSEMLGMHPKSHVSEEELALRKNNLTEFVKKFDAVIDQSFERVLSSETSQASVFLKRIAGFAESLKSKGILSTSDLSTIFKIAYKKYFYDYFEFFMMSPEYQDFMRNFFSKKNSPVPIVDEPVSNPPSDETTVSIKPLNSQLIQLVYSTISSFSGKDDMAYFVDTLIAFENKLISTFGASLLNKSDANSFAASIIAICSNLNSQQQDCFFEIEKGAGMLCTLFKVLYEGLKVEYVPDYVSTVSYSDEDFIKVATHLFALGYDGLGINEIIKYYTFNNASA